ncbi:tRNA uridine-5-carboxymethylaminomethyl(34) synthesis GTPase MnmE [Paracoccus sp. 1_MG-2023]|uniref:tRNA uridine-5-carboxymethylaminomethyl(34) synthesis GTPase MnmE n=1 Tax=unclassified Paracoccus (in: a-proteobacteria) TaxID=2688777 RepID=UPI001C097748|nr:MULTISPECIES: tRNA uridine-5-carboxymethylaminomethyl(34) synthesis GTPase MnmE [unclassified Paracoccus (in: a-proteobacteria)]MBU2957242.1 tRNA uridine-5-carboxymethylaminomethyl(34) synthesis GTPase MnmE [Paracoccus sp. C2R09]MDO6669129.1 tRNA uridine-5-carboxymethylaminomethyl(34) synthesis GTPase MnmE [Paracoccus sp. 1_MG-2023]
MDLIFAEATPPGRGGVSVIRISGDGARAIAERMVGPMPKARHAYFRNLVDRGENIDQVLAIWFAAGSSFTGEEVAELQLHGAPVVVRRTVRALLDLGIRPADAGEFTRRAFLNGRMDLAEIEGLGDLLAAETEAQRKLALRAASGELAQKAETWRAWLIEAGALVEVSVDFADEEVPDDVPERAFELIETLRGELKHQIDGFSAAERIREGFEVAIVGPPNSGKSSLINRLSKRDVAIVSDIAGTTRDVIEVRMDLGGLAVTMLDTAGLRESRDAIESIGIDRARERARNADLRVHMSDEGQRVPDLYQSGDIVVASRADLRAEAGTSLPVSSETGQGVDDLLALIQEKLTDQTASAGIVSHERQRTELITAFDALADVRELPVELVSESLRVSNSALDRLLGRIDAEDYLDLIFSSFCIGK